MGGKHFAVGVNIDALPFGLLQKQIQIVQIVAADNDKRAFFNAEWHSRGFGCSIRFGIGLVQQFHYFKVDFASFQHQRQKLIHAILFFRQCSKRFYEETIDALAFITQCLRVISISGNSTDTKQNQRLQRTNVLISVPNLCHIKVLASSRVCRDCSTILLYLLNHLLQRVVVKADICNCGKQSFCYEPIGIFCRCVFLRYLRQQDHCSCQFVL